MSRTKHDNNHVLNSWWLRLVESSGPPEHWFRYRLWSLLTGVLGSLAMAAIAWRRSPLEGVFAAGIGSLSYVLIHYSSECRGYASVCCFATLAWLALDRGLARPRWGSILAFWLSCVLGVLSHSTFAFAYVGFCGWSLLAWRQGVPGARPLRLVALHSLPFVFLTAIYVLRIRGMTIGGGPAFWGGAGPGEYHGPCRRLGLDQRLARLRRGCCGFGLGGGGVRGALAGAR